MRSDGAEIIYSPLVAKDSFIFFKLDKYPPQPKTSSSGCETIINFFFF